MKIIGTGSAIPSLKVTNEMLTTFLDTSDEWIKTRTGIQERRIMSDEDLRTLAVQAAQKALADAHLEASDIDYLICSNVVNTYVTPSLSCIVAGDLNAECPCMDLNAACSGFIYALDMADALMASGKAKNILVVCAEEPTRMLDWRERGTCVLFGDGAGAVVLAPGDGVEAVFVEAVPTGPELLYYQRELEYNPYVRHHKEHHVPLHMNGREVFKMAVSACSKGIRRTLDQASIMLDDVKFFLLHQANIRILESIRQTLHQPEEKFPHNIERLGNTSSASVPILLDELASSGRLSYGDVLVMSAFGGGFTSGTCVIKWQKS